MIHRKVVVPVVAAIWMGLAFQASGGQEIPDPTFVVSFDGTTTPKAMAGRKDHPAETAENVRYTSGRKGQAVLLGDGPILVYHVHGNIPDQATITFWIKPIEWESLGAWRDLMVIRAAGRQSMYFSHYPRHRPSVRFLWSTFLDPKHEGTDAELKMNEWNHVAIAWNGVRSRVYFNGRLVLSKNHPAGFRPEIPGLTTLHLGGIMKGPGRGVHRGPWGHADTAYDELMVFPGTLDEVQIASLAGIQKEIKPLSGIAEERPLLAIPKLSKSPDLDGHLADGEWDAAATLHTLIDARDPGRSFDYPRQRVHFAYDDQNLYVAMRSHFPPGANVLKAPKRNSLAAEDVEVWSSESFELYLAKENGGSAQLYRFAGSPGGGFAETLGKDYAWNGQWTYRTSIGKTIHSTDYWDVEVGVPFETLGVARADETSLKMNFGRTWRCLDKLGITSWIGSGSYPNLEHFGRIRLSPSAPGYTVRRHGSPATGNIEHTFVFQNPAEADYRGSLQIMLEAELSENNEVIQTIPIEIAAGKTREAEVAVAVSDPMFRRLRYTLTAVDGNEPQLRYSVPFALRTDFLDVVPLCLQNKLVIKAAHSLFRASLRSQGGGTAKIMARVVDPAGKKIFERRVEDDADIWVDLPPDGPWGSYRVSLFALDADGKIVSLNEREFQRPAPPVWITERDDSMDRVLPPFTPLQTVEADDQVVVSPWGRDYRYRNSLFPDSIKSASVENILAGPIRLVVDGAEVSGGSLRVKRASKVRSEFVAQAENKGLKARNTFWIEYDGLIYNTLELRADKDAKSVTLRVPYKTEHAPYAHITESGFGAGGGSTRPVDRSFSVGFWPVVWLGDFERGLCWFAEGKGDLRTKAARPIAVLKDEQATVLEIRLADALSAGETVTIKFGFVATPVKPLHPRYPLNIHAGMSSILAQPPKRVQHSRVTWGEQVGFRNFKIYQARSKQWYDLSEDLARSIRESKPCIVIPYMTPYTVPSESEEVNHYVREWELLPARHQPGTRALPDGGSRPYTNYWLSPQSISYRRFYAHNVADMIQRTGLEGLYFDFGVATRDGNSYHGANGGICILGLRDHYRRIANEFVKAGIEDYVIIVHNSMSVQIPALTFVTHFFSGEQHRQQSGSTLHQARDYLDTLPLYYFGIEHSGLPWGIHGNMLPEFPEGDHLLPQIGVKDETTTEYLWDRTSSIMMPILLHNCLPAGYRLNHYYYKSVYNVLDDFDVPSARFHPYWRNEKEIELDNPDFRVSFYTRPEAPRALLVVGNLSKQPGEVTIKLDMTRLYDWTKARGGMARVKKKGEILQVVERLGARDARILETGAHHVKLWVNGHSMALVEVAGHQRLRY